jgi:hypothetical protein
MMKSMIVKVINKVKIHVTPNPRSNRKSNVKVANSAKNQDSVFQFWTDAASEKRSTRTATWHNYQIPVGTDEASTTWYTIFHIPQKTRFSIPLWTVAASKRWTSKNQVDAIRKINTVRHNSSNHAIKAFESSKTPRFSHS